MSEPRSPSEPTAQESGERLFEELTVGMSVEEEREWTPEDVEAFRRLTGDTARVHYDRDFARAAGFRDPLVFGLLAVSAFSRLLGCRLPGMFSVIHSVQVDFAGPVYPNERLSYRCTISQLSPATKSAVLQISASRPDGTKVLRGRAQCGLLK